MVLAQLGGPASGASKPRRDESQDESPSWIHGPAMGLRRIGHDPSTDRAAPSCIGSAIHLKVHGAAELRHI